MSTFVAALAVSAKEDVLVIEADPAGGVVAARWGWSLIRDTTRLAADGEVVADLWEQARPWVGRSRILPGSSSPVAMSSDETAAWLQRQVPATVMPLLVDLGRLQPSSLRLDLLAAFDEVWLVSSGLVADITLVREWSRSLASWQVCSRLFLRESAVWSDREISEAVGIAVAGRVPEDPRAAAALTGTSELSNRLVSRSSLVRTAAEWSSHLAMASMGAPS